LRALVEGTGFKGLRGQDTREQRRHAGGLVDFELVNAPPRPQLDVAVPASQGYLAHKATSIPIGLP